MEMNCVTCGCTRLSVLPEELCVFFALFLMINQCVMQWRVKLRDPVRFLYIKVGFLSKS